jgi:hypothetical protein
MHSRTQVTSLAVLATLAFASSAAAQQPDPLTDLQITGHVYEPHAS